MEDDDALDLNINSGPRSPPPSYRFHQRHQQMNYMQQHHHQPNNAAYLSPEQQQPGLIAARRILRPYIDSLNYAEGPLINGTRDSSRHLRTNGSLSDYSSGESSDEEMPPIMPVKELSPSEVRQRDRGLRRLREELRAEEMKLVLLKKLKQSQQLKENVAIIPPNIPASALPPTGLPSGLSITPTTVKMPSNNKAPPLMPQTAHSRHSINTSPHSPKLVSGNNGSNTSMIRVQQPPPPRSSSVHGLPLSTSSLNNRMNLSVPQPPQRSSITRPTSNFPPGVKDLSPSVTITPAPPQPAKERSRTEDNQTPAQRQAAAKLALRKQLEKTLLQIPPPKPPPPEMHFIPNPSNTEFIYLVGLEHVVDFITKETRMPLPPQPFACSQCQSDFTPVWKWELNKKNKALKSVICEQCVTNNVKKALKAEHTNRLKTAFVKALQQEQEIEQRLAQNSVFTSSSPIPSPVTPEKPVTPTPRHETTPPSAPPQPQLTPPPPPLLRAAPHGSNTSSGASSHSSSTSSSVHQQQEKYASLQQQQDKYTQQHNAAAMQALHQQLLRSLSTGAPPGAAHMLQFSPLLYPYQLAMAQAAASSKNSPSNLAELQRAADLHRQYLLDMIPPGPQQRHNWKT